MDLTIPKSLELHASLLDFEGSLKVFTKTDAIEYLQTLANQESEDWFRMGLVLSSYKQSHTDDEFKDLAKYAEEHFDITLRKAYYLISIHDSLVASNITLEQVSEVGWTKLKEVAHLLTQENVAYWVNIAKSNTTKQIIALLKSSATKDHDKSEALNLALDDAPVEPISIVENTPTTVLEDFEEGTTVAQILDVALADSAVDTKGSTFTNNVIPSVIEGDYAKEDAVIEAVVAEPVVEDVSLQDVTHTNVTMPSITLDQLVTRLSDYKLDIILQTLHDIYPHITIKVTEKTHADAEIID